MGLNELKYHFTRLFYLHENKSKLIHLIDLAHNGPFSSCLCLCFKASLSAKPFLWKWLWHAWDWNCMQNSFSYERFRTVTRFETEAQENSEMPILYTAHLPRFKSPLPLTCSVPADKAASLPSHFCSWLLVILRQLCCEILSHFSRIQSSRVHSIFFMLNRSTTGPVCSKAC